METISKIYVGVDVSKDFLDIALSPIGKHFRISNDEAGIALMMNKLSVYKIERIVCEASGGYERSMIKMLRQVGYNVELVDPKVIRYFILSKKIKAKTDKIDAHMIASYAAHNESQYVQPIMSNEHEELRDMVRIRHNFVDNIAREKKRLKQAFHPKSKNFIAKHIEYLEEQIQLIEIEIKLLIEQNSEWKKTQKILLSMPGIGQVSATALIAEMPELGHMENKQAASLLGVAPRTNQSGTYEGVATISGGRFMLRKIMYMAALSASHAKGKFTQYYQYLKSKGKESKVCLVALMNKMISIANILISRGEMWNPTFK
jgi:transposase